MKCPDCGSTITPGTDCPVCERAADEVARTPALRSCPFCMCDPVHLRNEEYSAGEWFVACGVCSAHGPTCDTEARAREYWNRGVSIAAVQAPALPGHVNARMIQLGIAVTIAEANARQVAAHGEPYAGYGAALGRHIAELRGES